MEGGKEGKKEKMEGGRKRGREGDGRDVVERILKGEEQREVWMDGAQVTCCPRSAAVWKYLNIPVGWLCIHYIKGHTQGRQRSVCIAYSFKSPPPIVLSIHRQKNGRGRGGGGHRTGAYAGGPP